MIKHLLNKTYYWLLPNVCSLCGIHTSANMAICHPCKAELPWLKNACSQCGHELALESISYSSRCGSCLKNPPYYDTTIALFRYQQPIIQLITALKFHHKLTYAKLLGELMAEMITLHYLKWPKPEIIIPVPLHPNRLCERGYNQALELARPIAKKLTISIEYKHCIRIRETQAQSSLPPTERALNMKKAFHVTKPIKMAHVAIVDDVITTGNTINEMSRILKAIGVKKIEIWCCARTLRV